MSKKKTLGPVMSIDEVRALSFPEDSDPAEDYCEDNYCDNPKHEIEIMVLRKMIMVLRKGLERYCHGHWMISVSGDHWLISGSMPPWASAEIMLKRAKEIENDLPTPAKASDE